MSQSENKAGKAQQQTLFDLPKEAETAWERCFGWKPRIGRLACINNLVAYNIAAKHKRYAYCMHVTVRSIANGYAVCETTKGWENACQGNPMERAGELWHVPLHDLQPYFIQGVIQESD